MRLRLLSRAAAVLALVLAFAAAARADDQPAFVGAQACAGCHAAQAAAWQPSHHALAMQPATSATVLGDFSSVSFDHFGVTTTFFRDGDRYMVRTEGPDAALHDYPIAYTFGVHPLQQYLIAMPGGRYQALGIAWDSRAKAEGGQRWFHLYPDQRLPAGDRLHWTGRDQTWNYMCADCHSTGVVKNFDLGKNAYATTWTDVNVGCESCHGPGSRHIAWAQSAEADRSQDGHKGLVAWLKPTDGGRWEMNEATGIAHRTEKLASSELDACAGCHARRKQIAPAALPGTPFLDADLPAYLEPGLYHADGQIDGEVFEYGSFLQSRMYHAGVTCSNCHDPHSLSLRAEGNGLCAQCHMPAKFDVTEHHHHEPGSAGAQCANCHMPAKTYMGVDTRRDHSFRVPRPDLSEATGSPNTCTQCHTGRDAAWAARTVAQWYPNGRQMTAHYGTALQAGRTGARDAEAQLDRLILDPSVPGIARGSAILLLRAYLTNGSKAAVTAAASDPDPIVRAAVPRVLPATLSPAMVQSVAPLLKDPVRAVRIETARALAGVAPQSLAPDQRTALSAAYLELVAAEQIDRDRPEAHLNIGLLNGRRGQPDLAEAEYRTALRLDPNFVPALANLADLERTRGRDQRGGELLRKAVEIEPANADVRHALGLLLVRQHDYTEALAQLRQASELAPGNARYAYVYAVALNSSGAPKEALAAMEQAHTHHPADRDILAALIGFARGQGDGEAALRYARELAAVDPANAQVRALIQELGRKTAP
jgi:predicted CXXCH cytochrome family protein